MLRCFCLVKRLVIGRDRELKAKTKTMTTSTAKNMIRISKTTTLHECITLHCSSLCCRSQPYNSSFRFLLFSLITFLCLERFLISPLSNKNYRTHRDVKKWWEHVWHFLLMLTLLEFYAGQHRVKNCEFLRPHEGCERLSGGLVQGGLASGGARRPGRIQQLIINRQFTFSLYLVINLRPSCCSICSPYVRTFFSLLILFLILLISPVQRSSHFICLLMNNVLFFITMRTRVPITCLLPYDSPLNLGQKNLLQSFFPLVPEQFDDHCNYQS